MLSLFACSSCSIIGGRSYWARRPAASPLLSPEAVIEGHSHIIYQFNSIQALQDAMCQETVFKLQLQAQTAELVTLYGIFYLPTELVSPVYVAVALTVKSALQLFKSTQ